MIDETWPTVRRGTWLYGNQVPSEVRIIRGNIMYGSGDFEDPPAEREDRECECYYVVYNSGPRSNVSHGGVFPTIDEAITAVESVISSTLRWQEDVEPLYGPDSQERKP